MMDMLSVQGLKASYGAAQILDNVSFAVRTGAVTALLGRNGAGKSTTFKAIVGVTVTVERTSTSTVNGAKPAALATR